LSERAGEKKPQGGLRGLPEQAPALKIRPVKVDIVGEIDFDQHEYARTSGRAAINSLPGSSIRCSR